LRLCTWAWFWTAARSRSIPPLRASPKRSSGSRSPSGPPRSCAKAAHAREIAIATALFAIAGFVLGLTFTVRGGGAVDVAYHAAMLPLLLLTLIFLLRSGDRPSSHDGG
jgi:hypothetical protein